MLYKLAFAYAHVFLFEFNRQFVRNLPYPDNYIQVVKSVVSFSRIPLGYGYERYGVLRSGTERESEILSSLLDRSTYSRIKLRDVVKLVLNETLLSLDTSPFNKPKQISKAVDSVITSSL